MYKKVTLKNGVRVLLVPDEHTKAATALVLFRVGSRYEKKAWNGLAHFIEHMMFKGTPRRPMTADISRELDAHGAEYNAFTGKDVTGYYIKIDSRHFGLALDMLADMLTKSKFAEKEINQERKVIMEEIHMYKDNPMMRLDDLLEESVFSGSSLGWNTAGDAQSMARATRKIMLAFRDAYYTASRTVVVVSGNIGAAESVVKLIEKKFGAKTGKTAPDYKKFAAKQTAPRLALEYKDTEQVQMGLAFPAFSYTDKRLPALGLLANILGGTMSSRLFINIRERKALAYFVRAGVDVFEDTGLFLIRAGLNRNRAEEAIGLICDELKKIRHSGVTEKELRRAKDNIRGRLVLELEDSGDLAGFYGKQELHTGRVRTPEEKLKEVERVTASQILEVARAIIKKSRANLAVIGPFKNSAPLKKTIRL
jgi:predicted Zn-dependent peptidase